MAKKKHGYCVYRCYDVNGLLLYVGVTKYLPHRMAVHRQKTPWIGDVARVEATECPDKATAWALEASAIQAERPLHNVLLNNGRVRKSVSMTAELAEAIERQVAEEGHRNFSAVIVKAVQEYLLRHLLGKKAA